MAPLGGTPTCHRPVRPSAVLHRGHQAGALDDDARLGVGALAQGAQRARGVGGGEEVRQRRRRAQQAQVDLDAVDAGLPQRLAEPGDGAGAVVGGGDDLGEQRVVRGGDVGAGLDPAVDAHALAGGQHHLRELAGAGAEARRRVLRVDAGLDGAAAHRHAAEPGPAAVATTDSEVLVEHRGVASCQAQHPRDEVDAGDGLGDRVLDLQAGVDLQERGLLPRGVVDELHGARRAVAHRRGEAAGAGVQLLADGVGQRRRGGLLDHLLVAPLQGAVAVAQGERRDRCRHRRPAPPRDGRR